MIQGNTIFNFEGAVAKWLAEKIMHKTRNLFRAKVAQKGFRVSVFALFFVQIAIAFLFCNSPFFFTGRAVTLAAFSSTPPVTACAVPAPSGRGPLAKPQRYPIKRQSFPLCQGLSLWESWREAPERASRQKLIRKTSRKMQKNSPLRGNWQSRKALTEGVFL